MRSLTHPIVLAPKAGVSVALALTAVQGLGLRDALSATFVALVCTSPSTVTGIRRGVDQLVASVAGGIITTVLLEVLPRNPITLGLALAITVLLVFAARLGQVYVVAGFTVLYVYVIPASSPEQALEARLLSLSVGVVAATIVNLAVSGLFTRPVYLRRIEVVREAVGEAISGLATDAADPDRHAGILRRFDAAFPILWTLGAELADAEAEVRFRPALQGWVAALSTEVQVRARLLHFAKGLAMHLDATNRVAIGEAAASLQATLGGAHSSYDPGAVEWAGLFRRAHEAARDAVASRADGTKTPANPAA